MVDMAFSATYDSFRSSHGTNSPKRGNSMKPTILLLLLASASCIAQAQATPSVSGVWKVHTNMMQESDSTCTFTLKDTDLSGTCEGDFGQAKISGKVDGKKAAWSFNTDYNGSKLTVSYVGELESDS